MANLKDSPKFKIHDDYYTPKSAWANISHLIPKDIIILEACMLNAFKSKSPDYLEELGCMAVFRDYHYDFINDKHAYTNYDMIITNPPFETELKKKVLIRLTEINKPFIIIMSVMNIYTKYFKEIFKGLEKDLQIIIPYGKINFDKLDYETDILSPTKNCSFYSCYVAYKMNIPNECLYLHKQ